MCVLLLFLFCYLEHLLLYYRLVSLYYSRCNDGTILYECNNSDEDGLGGPLVGVK